MIRPARLFLCALQFLTRLPTLSVDFQPDDVTRSAPFYPVVGWIVGALCAGVLLVASRFWPGLPAGALAIAAGLLITGGFHEDGLADTTDALGGGWTRPRMLEIMHDSRIGSFGTLAVCLSLLARWVLLSAMAPERFPLYILAAHVLCRWSTLPLGTFVESARTDGLGAKLAHKIPLSSAAVGTVFAFAIVGAALRTQAIIPVITVSVITLLSALYYRSQIGGITGDCFGATNQLAEIAVYLCGVWV